MSCNRGISLLPGLSGRLSQAWLVRWLHSCACKAASDPLTFEMQQLQQPVFPAQPGSVAPFHHHVFVRLASRPPPSQSRAVSPTIWPAVVEREPGLSQVFAEVVRSRQEIEGVVRVTAFEPMDSRPLPPGCVDMFIYPAGVGLYGLQLDGIGDAVRQHISSRDVHLPEGAQQFQDVSGMLNLFVCCHGARDARCGIIGTALCAKLERLVRMRGLHHRINVLMCSHIGGHKFAGNVLVYGTVSPSDGDWFGGVNAGNAERFLDALLDLQVDADGGPADAGLRPWWRGRLGLSKAEQLQFFESRRLAGVFDEHDDYLSSSAEDEA